MDELKHYSVTIDIDAPPKMVWSVMSDVERWPEWTPSVTTIRRLDPGPLAEGSRARIRQPKMPPVVWKVTALEPNRGFTWKTRSPGVVVTASHSIEPTLRGCRVILSVEYSGLFGKLVGRLTRNLNNRYLNLESAGLKRRSESILQELR